MVAVIAIYFLVWTIKVIDATTLVSNDNVSIIPVTQWCDTPEAVNKIIRDFKRPTHKTLLEYGCHWVPKFIPVEGIIEEIIQEYFIFGTLRYMVRIRLIGNFENPIGYTLILGK